MKFLFACFCGLAFLQLVFTSPIAVNVNNTVSVEQDAKTNGTSLDKGASINVNASTSTTWDLVGCYTNNPYNTVVLSKKALESKTLTPVQCTDKCVGYTYAGLQNGTVCYCGNEISDGQGPAKGGSCATGCGGDASQTCGGDNAVTVYTKGLTTKSYGGLDFITWDKTSGRLLLRNKKYKFASFNVPDLTGLVDREGWAIPNNYEIEDAVNSIKQMRGRVIRTYTLGVGSAPRHFQGANKYGEEAFRALDYMLAMGHKYDVRFVIPFIDFWNWPPGGVYTFAELIRPGVYNRSEAQINFWTDEILIDAFKDFIRYVLNRVNTYSGIRYGDDPAVLAWESGNELGGWEEDYGSGGGVYIPGNWTLSIASLIKKELGAKQLFADGTLMGFGSKKSASEVLADTSGLVDIVSNHYYGSSSQGPNYFQGRLISDQKIAADAQKALLIGEFGLPDEGHAVHKYVEWRLLDAILNENVELVSGWKNDWNSCNKNYECKSGCCGNQYSDDGKYKCIPGGTGESLCTGSTPSSANVTYGGKPDNSTCAASWECTSTCCSSSTLTCEESSDSVNDDTCIKTSYSINNTVGALAWSLRFHSREGGFFTHSEGDSNADEKFAFHWPSGVPADIDQQFGRDNSLFVSRLRSYAFKLQGKGDEVNTTTEADSISAPSLYYATGGNLKWRGSTGAVAYEIYRTTIANHNSQTTWTLVATNVSDNQQGITYPGPVLWTDPSPVRSGRSWYRVLAYGSSAINGAAGDRSRLSNVLEA